MPAINSFSGAILHGQNLIINGSGFGLKSPVLPLHWNDCEGKTVEDDAAVAQDYSDFRPSIESGLSPPYPSSHRMRYRSFPHEGTMPPHIYSYGCLSGGHWTYANNSPPYRGTGAEYFRDVQVTIDSGVADKSKWFLMFYMRHNPEFWLGDYPGYYPNIKYFCLNRGGVAYSGQGFAYDVYRGGYVNPNEAGPGPTTSVSIAHGSAGAPLGIFPQDYQFVNNPMYQWIKMEFRIQSDALIGRRDVYIDNVLAAHYHANWPNWFNNSRSVTVGGYYQVNLINNIMDIPSSRGNSGGTEANPINRSFRYYDDIYADNTFQRVVIANHVNYANASIVEPQLPIEWNDSQITVILNLGNLQWGNMWLFVFDENDVANGIGYPLYGEVPDYPPEPPYNFGVLQ